jgi:hypothetical protein
MGCGMYSALVLTCLWNATMNMKAGVVYSLFCAYVWVFLLMTLVVISDEMGMKGRMKEYCVVLTGI